MHRELGLKLAALTAGMFFFGFALVPLYDIFCDLTGLGGRTADAPMQAEERVDAARTVRVEFVASVGAAAPWEFRPISSSMRIHPGEIREATFHARNLTQQSLSGQAVPSVAPGLAARHFKKIDCFCFTTQPFAPDEERELKLVFMLDPALPEHMDVVSLSYTLFAVGE